ncbi:MAG: hypothetical protein FWC90_03760, partial [Oscillospiraceae bacterium]|nr:hypothetical protein [Oscillospiraceae bacterium]
MRKKVKEAFSHKNKDQVWIKMHSYANQLILKSGNIFYFNGYIKEELFTEYENLIDEFKER